MKLIVDAETWLYRYAMSCVYSGEWKDHSNPNDPGTNTWMHFFRQSEAQQLFRDAMQAIQEACPDHSMVLAMGDRTNFRYSIFKEYKSNRRKTLKPAGYEALIAWAETEWPSTRLAGVEADDVCGIIYEEGDIICSRDKDLMTIPGVHLVGDKEIIDVSIQQADHRFYMQCLTGDATDGYPGLKGVGPKKAEAILEGHHPVAWWDAVLTSYVKAGHDYHYALTQARCARILRAGEYDEANNRPILWEPVPF